MLLVSVNPGLSAEQSCRFRADVMVSCVLADLGEFQTAVLLEVSQRSQNDAITLGTSERLTYIRFQFPMCKVRC